MRTVGSQNSLNTALLSASPSQDNGRADIEVLAGSNSSYRGALSNAFFEKEGSASFLSTVTNLANAAVGAGVLAFPRPGSLAAGHLRIIFLSPRYGLAVPA